MFLLFFITHKKEVLDVKISIFQFLRDLHLHIFKRSENNLIICEPMSVYLCYTNFVCAVTQELKHKIHETPYLVGQLVLICFSQYV